MGKLTEEQIQKARDAWIATCGFSPADPTVRRIIEAIAEHVQYQAKPRSPEDRICIERLSARYLDEITSYRVVDSQKNYKPRQFGNLADAEIFRLGLIEKIKQEQR